MRVGPGKLTAARLAEVEDIQVAMNEVGRRLAKLAEAEENGWTPGTPQAERTHRVEPLENLSGLVLDGVDMLERLYS